MRIDSPASARSGIDGRPPVILQGFLRRAYVFMNERQGPVPLDGAQGDGRRRRGHRGMHARAIARPAATERDSPERSGLGKKEMEGGSSGFRPPPRS